MGCYLVLTIAQERESAGSDGVSAHPERDAQGKPMPWYRLADAVRVADALAAQYAERPEAEREAEGLAVAVLACEAGDCEPHYTAGDARALDAWHAAEDKRGGDAYSPGGAWLE